MFSSSTELMKELTFKVKSYICFKLFTYTALCRKMID